MRTLASLALVVAACGGSSRPAPGVAPAPAPDARPTAVEAPPPAPAAAPPETPCDRVAARFDRLGASMMAEQPDSGKRAKMQYMVTSMRPILVDECQKQPFSPASIDCFTSATDEDAWVRCERALPQDKRDAMQERLDAIPPPQPNSDEERTDLAKSQAQRIAFEYFPQWAVRPSNRGCPASLSAMDPYARPDDTSWKQDPWGSAFTFRCEGSQMIVVSAGPDRKPGTSDDIESRD